MNRAPFAIAAVLLLLPAASAGPDTSDDAPIVASLLAVAQETLDNPLNSCLVDSTVCPGVELATAVVECATGAGISVAGLLECVSAKVNGYVCAAFDLLTNGDPLVTPDPNMLSRGRLRTTAAGTAFYASAHITTMYGQSEASFEPDRLKRIGVGVLDAAFSTESSPECGDGHE